jgi:hypothetical protein
MPDIAAFHEHFAPFFPGPAGLRVLELAPDRVIAERDHGLEHQILRRGVMTGRKPHHWGMRRRLQLEVACN